VTCKPLDDSTLRMGSDRMEGDLRSFLKFICKAFVWGMWALGMTCFFLVLYLLIVGGGHECVY
jgi:hypothetical protein